MACDGSPGNPGVETIPGDDGPDKVACLGCVRCRPPQQIGTEIHQRVEEMIQYIEEDPGRSFPFEHRRITPGMVEELTLLQEAAREREEAGLPRLPVPCVSTMYGTGCSHDTLSHQGIGEDKPNQACCCCTGMQNDRAHRTLCPMCRQRMGLEQIEIGEDEGPEEFAQRMGLGVLEVGQAMAGILGTVTKTVEALARGMQGPPPMNREQRRNQARGRAVPGFSGKKASQRTKRFR